MENLAIICFLCGGLGGVTFHMHWLISLSDKLNGKAIDSDKKDSKFRINLMLLKCVTGVIAGFIVYVWNIYALETEYNTIAVIAFIAGVSGDGLLGLFRKMANY